MTIALWCVLIASLIPYALASVAKSGRPYDNSKPRQPAPPGLHQRADWAQQNSWEAFAPFAAAVLIAQWTHAPQGGINLLALLFIAFRLAYAAAYIGNRPSLRSLLWLGGFLCVIGLYVLAAWTGHPG